MPFAPSPSHHHFDRCYVYHSQSWLVYDIVSTTLGSMVWIKDRPRSRGFFWRETVPRWAVKTRPLLVDDHMGLYYPMLSNILTHCHNSSWEIWKSQYKGTIKGFWTPLTWTVFWLDWTFIIPDDSHVDNDDGSPEAKPTTAAKFVVPRCRMATARTAAMLLHVP